MWIFYPEIGFYGSLRLFFVQYPGILKLIDRIEAKYSDKNDHIR